MPNAISYTAAAISYTAAAISLPLPSRCFPILKGMTGVERIQQIAALLFKAGSSLYLLSFGAYETFHSRQAAVPETCRRMTILQTPVETASRIGKETLFPSTDFLDEHGKLMAASGCLYLLDILQDFGLVARGNLSDLFSTVGSAFFLCANVYALEENIRVYQEIDNTDRGIANVDPQELHWLKQAALWGAMSNVGYIIATASVLFNGATAVTLLIAILSCLAGGMKILCDFYRYAMQEKFISL